MLNLGRELPLDSPVTGFHGAGADGLAGGGTPRLHARVYFPGSGGRASGQ